MKLKEIQFLRTLAKVQSLIRLLASRRKVGRWSIINRSQEFPVGGTGAGHRASREEKHRNKSKVKLPLPWDLNFNEVRILFSGKDLLFQNQTSKTLSNVAVWLNFWKLWSQQKPDRLNSKTSSTFQNLKHYRNSVNSKQSKLCSQLKHSTFLAMLQVIK